jgi:antitoxin YefM
MKTISYTSARAHLSETMHRVCEDHTPYIITRSNERPVVMMSLEDFESLQETNYLLKSPANTKRIIESIDEIEAMITENKKNKGKKK